MPRLWSSKASSRPRSSSPALRVTIQPTRRSATSRRRAGRATHPESAQTLCHRTAGCVQLAPTSIRAESTRGAAMPHRVRKAPQRAQTHRATPSIASSPWRRLRQVAGIIPKADHGFVFGVLEAHRAEGCRIEVQAGARAALEPAPAGRQRPQKMTAGKHEDAISGRTHAGDHPVGPRSDFGDAFTPRTAVAEQLPVGPLAADLGRLAPLVLPVIPFDEIGIDLCNGAKASQLAGATGALERAGEDAAEFHR